MSAKERRFALAFVALAVVTGGALATRLYWGATAEIPAVGSSYTEGILDEPHSINPIFAVKDADRDLIKLIFSGLLTYDGDGNIKPDLAESYDISADGKIYTITLRKNLQWHDGKPLNADDVLFTIHTIQNSQYRSPLRMNWHGVEMEKINDLTIRFTLRAPYTPFIENLTTGIIPEHIWDPVTPEQAPLHEANLKPVGSGPYMYSDYRQQKDGSITSYTLTRNPHYYQTGPYIQTITFMSYKTEDDLFAAWRRGVIEGFGPVAPERLSQINKNKSLLISASMPRIFGIFFNQKQAPLLQDDRVRQAIAEAIDKVKIAQSQHFSKSAPADYPLPWMGSDSPAPFAFNPDDARTLLAQAGWKDQDDDGILDKNMKDENGKSMSTALRFTLTTSDWPDLLQTADILKQMLHEVGIDIIIEKKTFSDLETQSIRPRNFEILLFGQVYGYEPDPFAFWHSSQMKDPGLNITFFANNQADKLLEDARRTQDTAARDQMYHDFSQIIAKELPAVFLFSQTYLMLLPADIQGAGPVKISLPSDRFNEIATWYRSTKRIFKPLHN